MHAVHADKTVCIACKLPSGLPSSAVETSSSSAGSSSDTGLAELPFTAGLLLGETTGAADITAGEEASGIEVGVNDGATGGGDTGLLLRKLVDKPKMSGRGSPRTGRLVAPAGDANGIGGCTDKMPPSVKHTTSS